MLNSKNIGVVLVVVLWTSMQESLGNGYDSDNFGQSEMISETQDFCMQSESFQPRCEKNEAIIMNSATYGRMRIGRCLTAEEVNKLGSAFGDDPTFFGCFVDVLAIFDRKCSGKNECHIRELDISTELKTRPCYPGLSLYLEVGYDCITVVDETRSCSLVASNAPTHIVASSESQQRCATKTQPWLVEAPSGQKIKVTLIDFKATQFDQNIEKKQESCIGEIVDKTAKKNISICIGNEQRTKYLYSSTTETLEIFYETQKDTENNAGTKKFALQLEAVGCTDLIPPEDAWLKRSDDSIVIGCYSNRQTWQLHCEGERWIGVFGNCSQETVYERTLMEIEPTISDWNNNQVLTVVAVCSLTLIICLTVLCTGIVCLRKYPYKAKSPQDYKTLDFKFNSSMNNHVNEMMQPSLLPSAALVNGVPSSCVTHKQMAPTYSVFIGDGEFEDNSK